MPVEKIKHLQALHQQDMKKTILKWDTALYTQYQRTKVWYLVSGVITGSIVALSFLNGAWSFGVALIAISIVYLYLNKKEVPHAEAIITPKGIQFANKFYYYRDIEFFWIEEHLPTFQALHLHLNNQRDTKLTIQFYDFTADHLSNVLRRFIPEDTNIKPTFLEHLIHILKL